MGFKKIPSFFVFVKKIYYICTENVKWIVMAEILVKSIKSDKEPKLVAVEDIPKQSKTDKEPKKMKPEHSQVRLGHAFLNPYGKPKVIEDGRKIK